MEQALQERRLVRIKQKGQLTLPARMLKDLGLKEGDVVEVEQTAQGQIVITPQEVLAMRALDDIGKALHERGLTLEELIESGREIRGESMKEQHDLSSSAAEGWQVHRQKVGRSCWFFSV